MCTVSIWALPTFHLCVFLLVGETRTSVSSDIEHFAHFPSVHLLQRSDSPELSFNVNWMIFLFTLQFLYILSTQSSPYRWSETVFFHIALSRGCVIKIKLHSFPFLGDISWKYSCPSVCVGDLFQIPIDIMTYDCSSLLYQLV